MGRILCFGDSNTYGYIPKTGERYAEGIRWTSCLDEKIRKFGFSVVEEGLVGRTTVFEDSLRPGRKGIDFLQVALESQYPVDGLVIMLGTNDCKSVYSASAEVIGKGLERLIQIAKHVSPGSRILILSPIHLGEKVYRTEYDPEFSEKSISVSKELKKVFGQISKKYDCDFLAASDYAKPSEIDQEHLTVEGHKELAEAIYKKIEKWVA